MDDPIELEKCQNATIYGNLLDLELFSNGYDHLKGQILAMDPLPPSINQAYYIIQAAKQQKYATEIMRAQREIEACAVINKPPNKIS